MEKGLALVTGASSGIGYHLAQQLASEGYDLVVAGKEREQTAVSARDAEAKGVQTRTFFGDLSRFEMCMDLWRLVEATRQPLKVACLNAGLGSRGEFKDTLLDRELELIGVNCASTVHLAKHVVRHMLAQRAGSILFTAAIVDESKGPGEAVYIASKAFVLAFSDALRRELQGTPLTLTTLMPESVDTAFLQMATSGEAESARAATPTIAPTDVAAQALKAMFAGQSSVVATPAASTRR